MAELWDRVRRQIREEITEDDYLKFINPLRAESSGDTLVVTAHNDYVAAGVQKRFSKRLQDLAASLSATAAGSIKSVRIQVDEFGTHLQHRDPKRSPRRSTRDRTGLQGKFSFESFIEGTSNEWAKNAALSVAEQPKFKHNPLLLYGDVGLGKTHLLHAVGNAIQTAFPHYKIRCMYSQNFVGDLVKSLRQKTVEPYLNTFDDLDALLVDDVHFFVDRRKSQEEFFHIFNRLEDKNCQLVFTCDKYPAEITGLEKRLRSRFLHGLSAELKAPDIETSAAILVRKAHEADVSLEESVALHIAGRASTNVRELEGLWTTIYTSSLSRGYQITSDYVDWVFDELLNFRQPTINAESVRSVSAEYYGVQDRDLQGSSRKADVVRARHMAIYISREMTTLSLQRIASYFGGRDHSSIKYACEKVGRLLRNRDKATQRDYDILVRKLK